MNRFLLFAAMFMLLSLQSCAAIAGIFKAGVWVGVIIVVVIIIIIALIVSKSRK